MITSKRLILAPVSHEHSASLLELWSDYEAIKYTYSPLLKTKEECDNRIERFIKRSSINPESKDLSILLNGNAIRYCGVSPMNQVKGEYGLFYQLCRSYWGNGYGYETADALLRYIVENSDMTCVFAEAVIINPASIAILKRIGFEQTHIEQNGFNRNGFMLDFVHFSYKR